jgi:hypothetical protein
MYGEIFSLALHALLPYMPWIFAANQQSIAICTTKFLSKQNQYSMSNVL